MDVWRHLRRSMKIDCHVLHDDSTSGEHMASSECSILDWTNGT